ncbi:hypothetical protein ID866_9370 [Astraeus odoratus]|nr:hypothetical protein ID866_9370 [Astraeus odoratus]
MVALKRLLLRILRSCKKMFRITNVDAVAEMLDPPGVDIQVLLQARARANNNLAALLGVTNTFTSDNTTVHDEFRARVEGLLGEVGEGTPWWARLVKVTGHGVRQFLHMVPCDFATFICCVTFHVWVVGVLNPSVPDDWELQSDHSVEEITRAIINVTENGSPTIGAAQIRATLENWIPHPDGDENYNPLNLIAPMYDKLWRLVAATVVCAKRFPITRNPLLDFADNPTKLQFRSTPGVDAGPSAENVMNEVLRLHPPVQHISRPYGLPMWEMLLTGRVQTADIRAVQKLDQHGNPLPEPKEFTPSRWQVGTCPAMFAFGEGPLRCPVRDQVPILAALIASKVMDHIDGVMYRLVPPQNVGGGTGNSNGWSISRNEL